MSLYVEWVNQIKTKSEEAWLTDSQRIVYNNLLDRWQAAPFVCLCGPPGSGKSFIGRLLSQVDGYAYTHDLSTASSGHAQIIVDNVEYSRLMRVKATMLGIQRVIVVSRRPPKDPMPKVELALTARDVSQFQRTLSINNVLTSFHTRAEGTDLGEVLRNEAVARGSENAATRP